MLLVIKQNLIYLMVTENASIVDILLSLNF